MKIIHKMHEKSNPNYQFLSSPAVWVCTCSWILSWPISSWNWFLNQKEHWVPLNPEQFKSSLPSQQLWPGPPSLNCLQSILFHNQIVHYCYCLQTTFLNLMGFLFEMRVAQKQSWCLILPILCLNDLTSVWESWWQQNSISRDKSTPYSFCVYKYTATSRYFNYMFSCPFSFIFL